MVKIMKQFRANQGRFGQNKARFRESKCGFANLQTRINTGGEGLLCPLFNFLIKTEHMMFLHRGYDYDRLLELNNLFM